jgi:hypothetical protein
MDYSLSLFLSISRTHTTQAERATRLKGGSLTVSLSLSLPSWVGGGGSPGGLCTQVGGGRMVCVHRHMRDEVYIHNKDHNTH